MRAHWSSYGRKSQSSTTSSYSLVGSQPYLISIPLPDFILYCSVQVSFFNKTTYKYVSFLVFEGAEIADSPQTRSKLNLGNRDTFQDLTHLPSTTQSFARASYWQQKASKNKKIGWVVFVPTFAFYCDRYCKTDSKEQGSGLTQSFRINFHRHHNGFCKLLATMHSKKLQCVVL